jgi:hypothetical protein
MPDVGASRIFCFWPICCPEWGPGFSEAEIFKESPSEGLVNSVGDPEGMDPSCPVPFLAQIGTGTWEGQPASHVPVLL